MQPRRPFQAISLAVTGAQSFKHRFPDTEPINETVPKISSWRCNLTGLSHVYNLYFVAYVGSIYVYEPKFPTQALSSEPALIVNTQPLLPNGVGYITPQFPRAVNKLVVQFLGDDEVLAVVRDDGDVELYYTRHIFYAIDRRKQPENKLGVDASDLRPHFHKNVGNSAWGLAIHRKARRIAVSSHNHEITIFTFALANEGEPENADKDFPMADGRDEDEREEQPLEDMDGNDVRIIPNGTANIPDIAFCNTRFDPTGRWLVAGDISGKVKGWNLDTMTCSQTVRTYLSPFDDRFEYSNRRNLVWGVMFLDPLSFRTVETLEEVFGLLPESQDLDKKLYMWNMSNTVDQMKGVRDPFRNVRQPVEVLDGNYADPLGTFRPLSRQPPHQVITGHTEMSGGDADAEDEERRADEDVDDDAEMGGGFEEETDMLHDQYAYGSEIKFGLGKGICGDLPCPIMQLSAKDMYMYQPSTNNDVMEHLPVPVFGKLFAQELRVFMEPDPGDIDRINMHAQIPSLGAVVVATQKGRVAIISLTQIVTELPEYKAQNDNSRHRRDTTRLRRLYGCRIDHVLPLASQEAAGHRPKAALHGMAIGPVQGTEELDDDLKRWRLMLMYQDHSILTYEIGKPKKEQADFTL